MLIAFVGFKDSGKNTAAAALYPYDFTPFSFADALKDTLAAIFCWDRALLEGITEESRAWRERIDPWWAAKLGIPQFTPRWAMTHIGTDVMRRQFHADLWVFNMERRLMLCDGHVAVIDCRYPNEIAMVHQHGGQVIRVERGPEPEWIDLAMTANHAPLGMMRDYARQLLLNQGLHETEFAWLGEPIDATILNNSTIADLHAAVLRVTGRSHGMHPLFSGSVPADEPSWLIEHLGGDDGLPTF
jgi:hypothetical protein